MRPDGSARRAQRLPAADRAQADAPVGRDRRRRRCGCGPSAAAARRSAANCSTGAGRRWGSRSTSSTARPSATSSSRTAPASCRSGRARWAAPVPGPRRRGASMTTGRRSAAGRRRRDRRPATRSGDVPGLLEPARRDARRSSPATGCGPATGRAWTRTATSGSRPATTTSSRAAAIASGRARSRTACCAIRRSRWSAVVGVPDPIRTEIVKAFVVLAAGREPSAALTAEIQDFVRDAPCRPRVSRARSSTCRALPLTATGKVMRRDLRARAADGS